ncbi:MAG: hypothetical protein ACXACY_28985 [Candidatus Hodarchaeales archaeon]|jgi:hypothetical protein
MESSINPLLTPEYYEKYLKTIDLPYQRDVWQVEIGKAKIRLKDEPLYLRETVDRRGRGASKTFDTMEQNLFLAVIGYRGIWFSSGRDQLEQPKIYLKYIIDRSPLLQSQISELLKESVIFVSGGTLKLKNLTELNARSGRADFITYDEEAQADKDAYNAAVSILAGSNLGFVFHISTPAKATVFEENYDRIKLREKKTGVKLTFRVIWDQASWLKAKEEWYIEQKEIARASGRDWYFRQEHEASFELPRGAVLQNVIYGAYPDWLIAQIQHEPLMSGLDWNPVSGHWIVGVKFTPDIKNVIIMEERPLGKGYTHELSTQMYNMIRPYYMRGNRLCVEDGGINEAYVKWLKEQEADNREGGERRLRYEEWDAAGVNKMNAVEFLVVKGITIWVDDMRFPVLAKQIQDLHWDPDSKEPKLFKDPADSPHAMDAFLHSISKQNRMDNVIEVGRFY